MAEEIEQAPWLLTYMVKIVILWVIEALMCLGLAHVDGSEATWRIWREELEVSQLCQKSSEELPPPR